MKRLESVATGKNSGLRYVNFYETDPDKQAMGGSIGSWVIDRANFVSLAPISKRDREDYLPNVFYQLNCVKGFSKFVWTANFGRAAHPTRIIIDFDEIINDIDVYSEFEELERRLRKIRGFKSFKVHPSKQEDLTDFLARV